MNNKDMTQIVNDTINSFIRVDSFDPDNVSDGFHTFGDLYKHRIHLFITLCKHLSKGWVVIRSKKHHDGSEFKGWFLLMLDTNHGQISYHLPNKYWDKCEFAQTYEKGLEFDGHTSDDVLERLLLI